MAESDGSTASLLDIVENRHIIVCTGSGGVGKTTAAATLAMAAADAGRRTIVVTIDPARRLAQSLGLDALSNTPQAVAGVEGLDAMMLDMKQTFDEVIERHAEDARKAERIKANTFYQQISSTLAGTQEYMAMEKLYDLHHEGGYDCIVVDTPPTRNALDFLDAPRRLTDFLDGRFLKMFLSPGLSATRTIGKVAAFGTGMFMRAAGRITGASVLDDLAEFFQSFDGMYEGFKQRAQQVYRLLSSGQAAFVVVATPEPGALREARYFVERLAEDGMPLAGVVINRVTPAPSTELGTLLDEVSMACRARLAEGDDRERAVAGMIELATRQTDVSARQARNIAERLRGLEVGATATVPLMATDVHDLEGLRAVRAHLLSA
ncbi:ArsA family ATPase [Euzebya tangerina]|uniref:ArsA family ATPase n=1 Tax=Euzebya tangerina TaxID=591198 RepID=UPI000E314315|nr:ArsA-related P-loop ATPase [Euzebya tangerina]